MTISNPKLKGYRVTQMVDLYGARQASQPHASATPTDPGEFSRTFTSLIHGNSGNPATPADIPQRPPTHALWRKV